MNKPSDNSASLPVRLPRIVRAQNDILTDDAGRTVIDLFSGNGAAILGHANPQIASAIKQQLDAAWIVGGLPTPILDQATSALESLLPSTHALTHFYSTGMEAAEFAMRMAQKHTGRSEIVGFSHAMHGKSAATAALAWENAFTLPHILRLPFLNELDENKILDRLASTLAKQNVAAVFVEPILGTGGGFVASRELCTQIIRQCQHHGTLCIFDEILTGFHRAGPRFACADLSIAPDVILLGKALGNGFPVSAVAARRTIPVTSSMLPSSTYSGNPLAAAAVTATLAEIKKHDLPAFTASISRQIRATLGSLPGTTLRGQGALWMLELPANINPRQISETLYHHGVYASHTGCYLRLFPAATITPENLTRACEIVRQTIGEITRG